MDVSRKPPQVPLIKRADPTHRELRAYSIDPSLAIKVESLEVSECTIRIPYEKLTPGPCGEYLEVIDFDPVLNGFYLPIDLDDPEVLRGRGYSPSLGDPRFHQQMVYAVGMKTILNFERAWGRRIQWAPYHGDPNNPFAETFVRQLRLYPHGMRAENAFYDPDSHSIIFGYFRARNTETNAIMPKTLVFTCLSADVIAHEMTHAILDGIHPRYTEDTNPDVLAFHEAFADLVALMQHFTDSTILKDQISKSRGDLDTDTQLAKLANEFGQGTTGYGALRDAIGNFDANGKWQRKVPNPKAYSETSEPHARGVILVSAIFDAFLSIYRARIRDLVRIASDGSGILRQGEIHPDLVGRLAAEANAAASDMLTMLVRAIDYCPPIDITFAEYLRAMITADFDIEGASHDPFGRRVAVASAFQAWGIFPDGVPSIEPASLRWADLSNLIPMTPPEGKRIDTELAIALKPEILALREAMLRFEDRDVLVKAVRDAERDDQPEYAVVAGVVGAQYDIEKQLRGRDRLLRCFELFPDLDNKLKCIADRELEFHLLRWFRRRAHEKISKVLNAFGTSKESKILIQKTLGIGPPESTDPGRNKRYSFEVHSARLSRIPDPERAGRFTNLVFLELMQSRRLDPIKLEVVSQDQPVEDAIPYRAGCNLVLDLHEGKVKYSIRKEFDSTARRQNIRDYHAKRAGLASLYFEPKMSPFAMIHSGVA